jgi:integrase
MATGVRQRHGRECNGNGRCKCPYEAFVYSKRDRKKIRKTFPTHAAAQAWRDDAKTAVRKRTLRAPASTTVDQAAEAWLDGARKGLIRNRKGDPYKPATIRAYEIALRLRVLPEIGWMRLSEITRTDLQDLVDGLLASGLNESTIGVTLLPLRAIYKRALARPDTGIAVNPTSDLQMPAVTGGRDRIASPDECAELLATLRPADRALWATAMYAGLRRGELMALRREDVDLAAGVIHVRRGWDAVEGDPHEVGQRPASPDPRDPPELPGRSATGPRLDGRARVRCHSRQTIQRHHDAGTHPQSVGLATGRPGRVGPVRVARTAA